MKEVSPYYKEVLWDFSEEDLKTFNDFRRLPFTGKTSLVDHTDKFLGVTPEHIVGDLMTSGSTGKPVAFAMTHSDLDRLAFNEALSFYSAGITSADRAADPGVP